MATKGEIGRLLASVMPLFAHYKPPTSEAESAVLVNAWHAVVGHLEPDILSAAFRLAATRSEFFPTPALVLASGVELTTPEKRSGDVAWGDVVKAIGEHGSYHPPGAGDSPLSQGGYAWAFDDPLVGKIVAAMGWRNLCLSEEQMADRAHFIKAYEQERDRAALDGRMSPALVQLKSGRQAEARQLTAGLADRMTKR